MSTITDRRARRALLLSGLAGSGLLLAGCFPGAHGHGGTTTTTTTTTTTAVDCGPFLTTIAGDESVIASLQNQIEESNNPVEQGVLQGQLLTWQATLAADQQAAIDAGCLSG